jgi:uncharacterized phage protein (TIGR01671 family)
MSRPIKFRAWDVFNDEMFYSQTRALSEFFVDYEDRLGGGNCVILEQSTGLKDKNGKEIYEGDRVIVRSEYETDKPIESEAVVSFTNGSFRTNFHGMILNENVCTGKGNWSLEIIGNIHDKEAQ